MPELINPDKIGTLIISTYRSGTHYLQDYISDYYRSKYNSAVKVYDEIHNINDLNEFSKTPTPYKVGIVNDVNPKCYLLNQNSVLTNWHVIRLTRDDKINHFISWFLFSIGIDNINEKLLHHATPNVEYINHLKNHTKKSYDITKLTFWILESAIIELINSDAQIDYDDLQNLDQSILKWTPNDYTNVTLHDMFTNANEIEHLLKSYAINRTQ
jgi:hypothetical protein